MPKNTRPALDAKLANADSRARLTMRVMRHWREQMKHADIPELVYQLNSLGIRAPRGGPLTYNAVMRALERLEAERDADAQHDVEIMKVGPGDPWEHLGGYTEAERFKMLRDFMIELGDCEGKWPDFPSQSD